MNGKYQYWFACVTSITGDTKRKLLEQFGTEEEIYKLTEGGESVLKNLPGKTGCAYASYYQCNPGSS